jgi:hypothetical protein
MVARKKKKKFNHPKSINKSISLSIIIFSHSVSILKQELKKKRFFRENIFHCKQNYIENSNVFKDLKNNLLFNFAFACNFN